MDAPAASVVSFAKHAENEPRISIFGGPPGALCGERLLTFRDGRPASHRENLLRREAHRPDKRPRTIQYPQVVAGLRWMSNVQSTT
mmetsp:Transcript_20681/g.47351  ORF Transcript_20681/g.47351 Transcript_20681/m.47351 type:complete len:86 (-) Transcript_20681:184-441(-)